MPTLLCRLALVTAAFWLVASLSWAAFKVPAYTNPVVDAADILSNRAEQHLNARIKAYRDSSGHELAVLTIESLDGMPIEDAAHQVYNDWGIGRAKEDDGVLLLIALNDRKMRLEVGYGLEGELTDLESGRLVNRESEIANEFRQRDFDGGVDLCITGIITAIGGEYTPPKQKKVKSLPLPVLFFIVAIIFTVISQIIRRRKMLGAKHWGSFGGPFDNFGGPFIGGMGGLGGLGRGGGGGGGGFSFGGGSSGGGGASGGW